MYRSNVAFIVSSTHIPWHSAAWGESVDSRAPSSESKSFSHTPIHFTSLCLPIVLSLPLFTLFTTTRQLLNCVTERCLPYTIFVLQPPHALPPVRSTTLLPPPPFTVAMRTHCWMAIGKHSAATFYRIQSFQDASLLPIGVYPWCYFLPSLSTLLSAIPRSVATLSIASRPVLKTGEDRARVPLECA